MLNLYTDVLVVQNRIWLVCIWNAIHIVACVSHRRETGCVARHVVSAICLLRFRGGRILSLLMFSKPARILYDLAAQYSKGRG